MAERRFPPPWSAELQPNHYVVRDANRQQIAYVYYENEPGRRSAAKLLSKDEARRANGHADTRVAYRTHFATRICHYPPRNRGDLFDHSADGRRTAGLLARRNGVAE